MADISPKAIICKFDADAGQLLDRCHRDVPLAPFDEQAKTQPRRRVRPAWEASVIFWAVRAPPRV